VRSSIASAWARERAALAAVARGEGPADRYVRGGHLLSLLLEARGHPFHAAVYTFLFLSADFLPAVRLTALGVWDVKRGRILRPSRRR
jgi:adenine deaminase